MLIAADDALRSAANSKALLRKSKVDQEVDKKFRKAIDLLCDFAEDFPLKDSTSGPNTGWTVTGGVTMSDKSKSATTILQALRNDLRSNVEFSFSSLSLNADGILANGL